MSTNGIDNHLDDHEDLQPRRSLSEERYSIHSSNVYISPLLIDDEPLLQELKSISTPKKSSQIPKLQNSKKLSTSMVLTNNKASLKTPRTIPAIPSFGRHAVQGVLVRFFRNGDVHHSGVKIAINEFEIISWEAFLNYLNRQPKLTLVSGAIRHVYSLNGQEIRSIHKFQNRQSYVVASSMFIRTHYRHINDAFNNDSDAIENVRSSAAVRWRSPPTNGEQLFIFPYSRLNMYESLILNRNLIITFDQWLNEEVTDLLSRYIGSDVIRHLYAIKKFEFVEVKSFSHLFNILKITDRFIGCTEKEFQQSKRYLATIRPEEFFVNSLRPRQTINGLQRYIPRQDAKLSISWVHGYDGSKEQTKTLYTLSENEILYVIGAVCILYDPQSKQQRFYTKHTNPITCVNIHQRHSLVASTELIPSKDRTRVSIHIWNHRKLETITELRKEQFGSDISLLSFSPKADDNFLLIVSRDRPKMILFVDWKQNEIIYSITTKSEKILSALFVFDTIEWIACISQQYLLFYYINWNVKPLRIAVQRESEVQNIYTGAVACDHSGERLIVGDKVGSVHVWGLINNEPKLIAVEESILENDVRIIVCLQQDSFILANGQNQIKLWNVKLNTIEQIPFKDTFGSIQSICCIRNGLAIGTKMNYILYKAIETDETEVIMRGHTSPSICLCYNKNTDHFYSISSDRYLFKWNNQTRTVDWSIKSPQLISCVDLHPERNIIVLGTETSKLLIYDTLSSYYITTILLKVNTGVKSVRFSPDGGDLAVGLQNGTICVFDVLGNGDFHLRTDGISGNNNPPIIDVIWSVDSSYLLGIYSDDNYNIWSIPSCEIVKGKNIQNIPWHQLTHPIACSIIDKSIAATLTSAIVLSPHLVLCSGKDGQLRLFRNYDERHCQTFPIGFGFIQTLIPSTSKNSTFLLSISNNPTIVEVQINIES